MNRIHSTDMNNLQFGKRIRTVRENLGYNQIEFCSLLNIPQSTLSAYETDRMQPTVASLMNIATKFNVSMDWLFGFEDEQTLSKTRLDIIKDTLIKSVAYQIQPHEYARLNGANLI